MTVKTTLSVDELSAYSRNLNSLSTLWLSCAGLSLVHPAPCAVACAAVSRVCACGVGHGSSRYAVCELGRWSRVIGLRLHSDRVCGVRVTWSGPLRVRLAFGSVTRSSVRGWGSLGVRGVAHDMGCCERSRRGVPEEPGRGVRRATAHARHDRAATVPRAGWRRRAPRGSAVLGTS
jgi:hypothetical protein